MIWPPIGRLRLWAIFPLFFALSFGMGTTQPTQATPHTNGPWWKSAVIYQVYPRSFCDSNGDGIGDLNGIANKLDYLKNLGIDAIWLNPIYPSALVDNGYDVTDFTSVDPQYGTLADFDNLVAQAGRRKIRVLMDFVPAHTSDRHPWFLESASSRHNSKSDWYVWSDGSASAPPSDWLSFDASTRSAWQFVPQRQQFYYHIFDRHQPELNWRNPGVKQAMLDAMQFWLRRGVSGFRLDAINYLYVDDRLRNNAYPDPDDFNNIANGRYTWNLPEVHQTLLYMRRLVESHADHGVLIGETNVRKMDDLVSMFGKSANELQLVMNFNLFWSGFSAESYRNTLLPWETQSGGWPLLFFSNHDFPRSFSRLGDAVHNDQIARVLATMLLTARGTPIIYYGEELGLPNGDSDAIRAGMEHSGRVVQPPFDQRDGARTPMQWSSGANAGFSVSTPWLPTQTNRGKVNVESETADRGSLLNLYRQLLRLRRTTPALRQGTFQMLSDRAGQDSSVFAYLRNDRAGQSIAVALNLSDKPQVFEPELNRRPLRLNIAAALLREGAAPRTYASRHQVVLAPYGILVTKISP